MSQNEMEIKDRRAKLLDQLDPTRMVGLEIGPLCRPVVARRDGPIRYLDHATTEELRTKYASDPEVDLETICPVDFVWKGEPLRQTIPAELEFDYVLASHVIEHVPDVIGWLAEIGAILKPGGLLSLAIPDRRYTFDYLRRTTTIADLVEAHLQKDRRVSLRHIFDHVASRVAVDPAAAWQPGFTPDLARRYHTDAEALALARAAAADEAYVDVHCTVYTAESFRDLLEQLFRLGLVDFEVASFFPPVPGTLEFFVTLRKLPPLAGPEEKLHRQLESLPPPAMPASFAASEEVASELAARSELAQVLASRSWRVTRPLRALESLAGRARRRLSWSSSPRQFLRRWAELRLLRRTTLFDARFYVARHLDLAQSGLAAAEHYILYGAAEGRDPHPLFETAHYLRGGVDLRGLTPLAHYLRHGAAAGRNPNALFDAVFYAERHPEVAASGKNPLADYVEAERAEDRRTHPLFDPTYYRRRYADARGAEVDALADYLRRGLFEDRDPNPLFDLAYYRSRYPDVVQAGLNPIDHYLRSGGGEGRRAGPLFDSRLYFQENPEVERAGLNPLAHFLQSLPAGVNPRQTAFAYRSWLASHPPGERPPLVAGREAGKPPDAWPRIGLLTAACDDAALPAEPVIAAILAQGYPRWEWRIAVPRHDPDLTESVEALARIDPRIGIVSSDASDPASLLNAALQAATGEFVAIADAQAILEPDALGMLAEEAGRGPAAMVYADEDRIDEVGLRSQPHFKPAWNRDLLYAWNYLGRPVLLRRALVVAAGGWDPAATPAHEYDLLLRLAAQGSGGSDLRPGDIRHVPAVLCHRPSAGSEVDAGERDAAAKALATHLQARSPGATVVAAGPFLRPVFPLPPEPPLVSIVIPTRDRLPLLRACLESLQTTDYPSYEVLVVDNDTRDGDALAYLEQLAPPFRVLRHPGAFNHSAINNRAVEQARGSVLVLLNNDTTVKNAAWLTEMVRLALRPDVGAVGAKLTFPDGAIQHAGVIIGINGVAGHAFGGLRPGEEGYFGRERVTNEYSAVTAACVALRRSVYEEVHGFDEKHFPVNFNDVDLCLRIRARGYKVLYCAFAELVHHESASRRNEDGSPIRETANESPRFRERWPDAVEDDPFYNPNLSLAFSFELAVPPRPGPRRL